MKYFSFQGKLSAAILARNETLVFALNIAPPQLCAIELNDLQIVQDSKFYHLIQMYVTH